MISAAYGLALEAKTTSVKELADCYGPWVGIRSNHVITVTGEFVGTDGSSRSISSEPDRQLLIALRAMADVIVVDAATARLEQYRAPSSGAALAIFSRNGNFSGIRAVEESPERCFLFSSTSSSHNKSPQHVKLTSPDNPLQDLVHWAEEMTFPALLLEAGPTLARNAFENKLVRQSAVTISKSSLDLEFISKCHPFDKAAALLSVSYSEDAIFTYWSH